MSHPIGPKKHQHILWDLLVKSAACASSCFNLGIQYIRHLLFTSSLSSSSEFFFWCHSTRSSIEFSRSIRTPSLRISRWQPQASCFGTKGPFYLKLWSFEAIRWSIRSRLYMKIIWSRSATSCRHWNGWRLQISFMRRTCFRMSNFGTQPTM